jgi:HK97 family phage portal protein
MGLRRAVEHLRSVDGGPGLHRPAGLGVRLSFVDNALASTGGDMAGLSGYSGWEVFRDAMSIPAFWRGSNLISDLLAQVDWDAYTVHGRDQEELITPRPPLLEQPSPPDTAFTVRKSQVLDYLINGNAIGIIATRDAAGRPTSLWPVPAIYCGVRRITDGSSPIGLPVGAIEYRIGGRTYSADDVIHVKGPCAPGALRGVGILEAHLDGAIITALEQQRQARNGARPGVPPGYLRYTADDPADPEDLEEARDDWMRRRDEGGVAALNANMEFVPVAWNPDQAQMIEARQLSLNEIANLLGLPSSFVNSTNSGGTSLTYTTVDSEALGLMKWSLGGHVVAFEQAYSLAFPRGTRVRANLDHFLRGDTASRYTAYTAGIDAGWLLRSEARKWERLPPVPGIDDQPLPKRAEVAVEKGDPEALAVAQVPPPGVPELPPVASQRAVSRLQETPNGRKLWAYWTGEGKARWAASPTPYRTLRVELAKEGVSAPEIDGEAAEIFAAVFHQTPAQHAKNGA